MEKSNMRIMDESHAYKIRMSAFFHNIFIFSYVRMCAYTYVHDKFGRKGTKKNAPVQIYLHFLCILGLFDLIKVTFYHEYSFK